MLELSQAKLLAHESGVGQRDQLLLLLGVESDSPKSIRSIKELGDAIGIRWIKKANLSDRLSKTNGLAIRTANGWELSGPGKDRLRVQFPAIAERRTSKPAVDLRRHLAGIANPITRAFLEEAVACCEAKLWRAAVVLSWCGAMAVLQDHIVNKSLPSFNAEAKRRDAKWKDAATSDDLTRLKEHDFLDVCAALSLFGKNVKRELQDNCLALRNACGHPNSLRLSEARVAAHLEMLMLNVFSHF